MATSGSKYTHMDTWALRVEAAKVMETRPTLLGPQGLPFL